MAIMKNQKSTLLLIICCLSTCIVTAQQHVETIKNTFLNPKSNKVLLIGEIGVAHRKIQLLLLTAPLL
jgi:glycerophosphoryl diester phosphodiesterase